MALWTSTLDIQWEHRFQVNCNTIYRLCHDHIYVRKHEELHIESEDLMNIKSSTHGQLEQCKYCNVVLKLSLRPEAPLDEI